MGGEGANESLHQKNLTHVVFAFLGPLWFNVINSQKALGRGMVAQWLLCALKGRVCAQSWEVEGSILPVAVTIRLHPWLCCGTAIELPIWGERSVKRRLMGQGQWTLCEPLEVQRGLCDAPLVIWLAWLSSQRLCHLLIGDWVPWGPLGWTAYLTSWLARPSL